MDWRKVNPGEDLSDYDLAWVNLAPINSLNGRAGAMGALWVLGSELPCVAFADDWQINAVFNGMRSLTRHPKMLTKYMLVGKGELGRGDEIATHWSRESIMAARERVLAKNPNAKIGVERYYMRDTDESVLPHADRLLNAAADFAYDRWARGMVIACPMYGWGNRSLIQKRLPSVTGALEPLDPSSTIYPLLYDHTPCPPEEKERGWILGALMPHDVWVNRRTWTWPIIYLGSKHVIRAHGGYRLHSESDVIAFYNRYWGVLSPPYPHAGSGWWRSRFIYAARVRSVLCCDRGEGEPLGKAYGWKHTEIEKMTTEDLTQLAADQAAALRPYMPSYESFIARCEAIVQRAYSEDKGGIRA